MKICAKCGSDKTGYGGDGGDDWRNINGEKWCTICWKKYIYNPVYNRTKRNRIPYKQSILFKDKQVHLNKDIRAGQCMRCGLKVGDEYIDYYGKTTVIQRTNMNHITYDENNPLLDTVEMCVGCHTRFHKLEKILERIYLSVL